MTVLERGLHTGRAHEHAHSPYGASGTGFLIVATAPEVSRRAFIRHTAGVPLSVRRVDGSAARARQSVNVSEGGLSFLSDDEIPVGSTIEVRIPGVDPPFQARGRVVWTAPEDECWCIGVQFLDAADAFRVRMVEQVCAIERYRQEIESNEGRALNPQEAAREWIGKYAGRFPGT